MVADELADLYKAAGHIPAVDTDVSADDPDETTPEEKPTRRRGRPAKRRK